MFESFIDGVGLALRLDTMLYISGGLFLGMFVGALPGFTTLMAMAILLPISFFLDPLLGIPFLIGVYNRLEPWRQFRNLFCLGAVSGETSTCRRKVCRAFSLLPRRLYVAKGNEME